MDAGPSRKRPRSDSINDESMRRQENNHFEWNSHEDNAHLPPACGNHDLLQPKLYHSNMITGGDVHFGDKIYLPNSLDSQQAARVRFLNSLRYPDMNLRRNQISDAHADTFSWLRADPAHTSGAFLSRILYVPHKVEVMLPSHNHERLNANRAIIAQWLRGETSSLCVIGKPGCGKSTLLKFMTTDNSIKKALTVNQGEELTFYTHHFWLSGSLEQRSLKGLWANLLHQILKRNQSLIDALLSRSDNTEKVSFSDWSAAELHRLFSDQVQPSASFCVCIDGLDEIDAKEDLTPIYDLLNASQTTGLKLLLSSRKEPRLHWLLVSFPIVIMHECTYQDMYNLSISKLQEAVSRAEFATVVNEELMQLARAIANKAEGIFLWACLMIGVLTQALYGGADIARLKHLIEMAPVGIEQLYSQMLSRSLTPNDKLFEEQFAQISCLVYKLPLNLLQFTLTVNSRLCQRVHQSAGVDRHLLRDIFIACRQQEIQLHGLTAGLLTTIRAGGDPPISWPPTDSSESVSNYLMTSRPYCQVCEMMLRRDELCTFMQLGTHELLCCICGEELPGNALRYMHDTYVVSLHRSASEFLHEQRHKPAPISHNGCQAIRDSLCGSDVAAYRLGCICKTSKVVFSTHFDRKASEQKMLDRFKSWIDLELITTSQHFGKVGPSDLVSRRTVTAMRGRHSLHDAYCVELGGYAAYEGAYGIMVKMLNKVPTYARNWYAGYLLINAGYGIVQSVVDVNHRIASDDRCLNSLWHVLQSNQFLKACSIPHLLALSDSSGGSVNYIAMRPAEECLLAILEAARSAVVATKSSVGLVDKILDLLEPQCRENLLLVASSVWNMPGALRLEFDRSSGEVLMAFSVKTRELIQHIKQLLLGRSQTATAQINKRISQISKLRLVYVDPVTYIQREGQFKTFIPKKSHPAVFVPRHPQIFMTGEGLDPEIAEASLGLLDCTERIASHDLNRLLEMVAQRCHRPTNVIGYNNLNALTKKLLALGYLHRLTQSQTERHDRNEWLTRLFVIYQSEEDAAMTYAEVESHYEGRCGCADAAARLQTNDP